MSDDDKPQEEIVTRNDADRDDLWPFEDDKPDDMNDEIPEDFLPATAPAPASGHPAASIQASSLAGQPVPPRRWIVPKIIPDRTVTMLGGDGATGKTLLALQLAVAMSAGKAWLGQQPLAGGCVFASAEDELDELHRRLADICEATDTDMASLTELHILPLAGKDATLATFEGGRGRITATALFKRIEAMVGQIGPKLLVVDTLADVFGGNENDRGQTRAFVGMLRGLAIEQDVAVLVNAHPSLTGISSGSGTSGSTGWSNSVRSRLYLDYAKNADGQPPDPDERVLTVKKVNYDRRGTEFRMRWYRGVFEPLAELPEAERAEATKTAEASVDLLFLELVIAYAAQGRRVGAKHAGNYAPAVFAKDPQVVARGLKKSGLEASMQRLFQASSIHIETVGPPSKKREQIAVVGRLNSGTSAPNDGPLEPSNPLPTQN